MAGSLQGPPFKTPSQCIRNSAASRKQYPETKAQADLLALLQCSRKPNHHHHRRCPHVHHLKHQPGCKNFQQQGKGTKQLKNFRTFSKLLNGCIQPRLGGYGNGNYVTASVTPYATAADNVLESIVQITSSSKFQSLVASDDTFLPVVNHNGQLYSTFCVQSKLFQ